MKKFRVLCSSVNTYECIVLAPNRQVVQEWFDRADGSEFRQVGTDDGFDLDDIDDQVDDLEHVDVTLTPACPVEGGFVIRCQNNPAWFWNNLTGWGDRGSAELYTEDERHTVQLPVEGEWRRVTCRFCGVALTWRGGSWVDRTDGDGCSGDDAFRNENQPHQPDLGPEDPDA